MIHPVSEVVPVSELPVHRISHIGISIPEDVDHESMIIPVSVDPVLKLPDVDISTSLPSVAPVNMTNPVLFSIRDQLSILPIPVDPESTIPLSLIVFPVFVSIGTTTSQFSSVDDIWMIILSFCVPLYS